MQEEMQQDEVSSILKGEERSQKQVGKGVNLALSLSSPLLPFTLSLLRLSLRISTVSCDRASPLLCHNKASPPVEPSRVPGNTGLLLSCQLGLPWATGSYNRVQN